MNRFQNQRKQTIPAEHEWERTENHTVEFNMKPSGPSAEPLQDVWTTAEVKRSRSPAGGSDPPGQEEPGCSWPGQLCGFYLCRNKRRTFHSSLTWPLRSASGSRTQTGPEPVLGFHTNSSSAETFPWKESLARDVRLITAAARCWESLWASYRFN